MTYRLPPCCLGAALQLPLARMLQHRSNSAAIMWQRILSELLHSAADEIVRVCKGWPLLEEVVRELRANWLTSHLGGWGRRSSVASQLPVS